jgi:hypothetical protein
MHISSSYFIVPYEYCFMHCCPSLFFLFVSSCAEENNRKKMKLYIKQSTKFTEGAEVAQAV